MRAWLIVLLYCLARCCQANMAVPAAAVFWNELDTIDDVVLGCSYCGASPTAGDLGIGTFDFEGQFGLSMKCASMGTGAVFPTIEFNDGWSEGLFPSHGGGVDFWAYIDSPMPLFLEPMDFFRLESDECCYALSICSFGEDGSGFVIEVGSGLRAASSLEPSTSLVDLFPEDSGAAWHHFLVCWNHRYEGQCSLFVDGESIPLYVTNPGDGFPWICDGNLHLGNVPMIGWVALDRFRVWNNQLSFVDFSPEDFLLMDEEHDCCFFFAAAQENPQSFALRQNAPNPFNPGTSITFELEKTGPVELAVYNLKGQHVTTLVDGLMELGEHQITFDATGLPSGVYYYRLVTQDGVQTKSMTLVK